jgi:hypothetical protein
MTTTVEKIRVMQAYEDGAEIESRAAGVAGKWYASDKPAWNWFDREYRVKPKPKEIWVNEYDDPSARYTTGTAVFIYSTRKLAVESAGANCPRVAVKYREVLDDE